MQEISTVSTTETTSSPDVFGLIFHADAMASEVVIIKSKAINQLIADGMDEEEALEYYDYNIAGAYGSCSYSCVDDTISVDDLEDMLRDDDTISDPPINAREYNRKQYRDMLIVLESDKSDTDKIAELTKMVSNKLNV